MYVVYTFNTFIHIIFINKLFIMIERMTSFTTSLSKLTYILNNKCIVVIIPNNLRYKNLINMKDVLQLKFFFKMRNIHLVCNVHNCINICYL